MPTNFPTSVDNFTNPTANDSLNLPSHSTQHANANDAIEAVEDYLLNGGQGLTLISNTSFSDVASALIDNVFTSTYSSYKLIFQVDSISSGNNVALGFQMRKAGTTYTTSLYRYNGFYQADTGTYGNFFASGASGQPYFAINQVGRSGFPSYTSLDLYNPQVSNKYTAYTYISNANYSTSGSVSVVGSGNLVVNDSYDGIAVFTSSANVTGSVRIYGYRNA